VGKKSEEKYGVHPSGNRKGDCIEGKNLNDLMGPQFNIPSGRVINPKSKTTGPEKGAEQKVRLQEVERDG